MNCQGVKRNLVSYLYDDLSAWKCRRVERHLKQCVACRTLVEQTRTVRQAVSDLPDIDPSEELSRLTLQRASESGEAAQRVHRPFVLRPTFGLAVVFGVVAIILVSRIDLFLPSNTIRVIPSRAPVVDENIDVLQVKKSLPRSAKPERMLLSEESPPQQTGRVGKTVFCANENGEENIRGSFLKALETYNKAFQKTGHARLSLLRASLSAFEKIAADRHAGTWQVLACALSADIYRALGKISSAVGLYQKILRQSATYPQFAQEARFALFKIRFQDQKDIDAARQEAIAIVDEASPSNRAGLVSLMMGDRLRKNRPTAAVFWYRKAMEIFPPASPEYDHAMIALAALSEGQADNNYITDWWVIGPFDDPENERLVTEYPPEHEIDLGKEYPGAGAQKVGWRRTSRRNRWPIFHQNKPGLQFNGRMKPDEHVSLYALTYVRAPKKTPVNLLIGSDDSVRCWVNDELVWSNPCVRGFFPDQDTVPATLRKGWNKILLKVANNRGVWGFFFQIVDRKGYLVGDLEFDPDAGYAYIASAGEKK